MLIFLSSGGGALIGRPVCLSVCPEFCNFSKSLQFFQKNAESFKTLVIIQNVFEFSKCLKFAEYFLILSSGRVFKLSKCFFYHFFKIVQISLK